GTLTDGNSNPTSYSLDTFGRPTRVLTADTATQTWSLNAAGDPVTYTDQLGRTTSYAYNRWADLLQVTYPDATALHYQYELKFHQVIQTLDALNRLTQASYDPTTGDLLTQTDAEGRVTSYTWTNGLKQTMTDALGRITTYNWNTSTRRQNS